MKQRHFTILAHRGGARGIHRENTIDAYYYALKNNINSVEMDIRLNHFNGEFFLEHDFVHTPKKRKNTFKKVLQVVKTDKVTLFCELKTYTLTRIFYAESFLNVIRTEHLEDKVVVLSFNPFVLAQLRRIGYKGKIMMVVGSRILFKFMKGYVRHTIKPDIIMFSKKIFSQKLLSFARNIKAKVFVHVVNDMKSWDKTIKLGVDGIETDYPIVLRDYIENNYGETLQVA